MIEIPPKFAGMPPVNAAARAEMQLMKREWKGAQGLAEDVRYYGKWMRDEAEKRIGHLYPKVEVTAEMAMERPDLKKYVGKKLTVIAWIWARTVKSPNPAFANVDVPLASTFMLCSIASKLAYVEPMISKGGYQFVVRMGKPKNIEGAKLGTSAGKRAAFKCVMSGTPLPYDYIRSEGQSGRMGAKLMAIVAEGDHGRTYLSPTAEIEKISTIAHPAWRPEVALPNNTRDFKTPNYGLTTFADIFTSRQIEALSVFSDLVQEAREKIKLDALKTDISDNGDLLINGGVGATAYADAVGLYLGFGVDKMSDRHSTLCRWDPSPTASGINNTFGRQALPMVWDYAEGNPLGEATGNFEGGVGWIAKVITGSLPANLSGISLAADASTQSISVDKIISTDPPYYDNIGYAELSDFFYIWLRRSLKSVFPDLFATVTVPKSEELVATPYRHGSKANAEKFFLDGMTHAMRRLSEQSHPSFPVTIYYAFKQSESNEDDETTNTGWDTFLAAVIKAGFAISGTWPMRTELLNRMIGSGKNALASSIVLVCRKRDDNASVATRRDFVNALKSELPKALAHLQSSNIAPVDLAQAAIGPGMAIYTGYAKVLDAQGQPLTVRDALALINQTLDEALAEQEGDFDADTRWALAWFEQSGFDEDEYGVAETLSKAKDTSVSGMVDAGIIASGRGKVRLLKPAELPVDWDPSTDSRLTTWEMVHQLIRVLESDGESAAASLVAQLGAQAETARELCYRLYTICERKKRNAEALSYNGLVQSWPEITRLAREGFTPSETQATLF
jgi:putative DNA methylase